MSDIDYEADSWWTPWVRRIESMGFPVHGVRITTVHAVIRFSSLSTFNRYLWLRREPGALSCPWSMQDDRIQEISHDPWPAIEAAS